MDDGVPVLYVADPKHHRKPWRLRFFVDGKLRRKFFSTREDAVVFWNRIQNDRQKDRAVVHAWKRAEWEEYRQAKEAAGAQDLREVVKEWREMGGTAPGTPSLREAAEQFLASKESLDRSAHTVRALRSRITAMVRAFDGRPLGRIGRNDLLDWILALPVQAKTAANYRNDIGNFFRWCVRREWIHADPLATVTEDDLPKIVKKPVGVLSLAESKRLLRTVESDPKHRQYLPWLALRMFAGVRREESIVFRWEWVDWQQKRLIIPAEICKTRDAWVIDDIEQNFWQWMRIEKKDTGKIPVPSVRRLHEKILPGAGIAWKRNAFRHTYATMHLSAFRDAPRTAVPMRHRSPQRLYQDYLAQLVPQAEAMRYFRLSPGGPEKK